MFSNKLNNFFWNICRRGLPTAQFSVLSKISRISTANMRSFLGWENLKMCLKHAAHIPKMNMLRQNNFMILSNSFWTSLLTIHFIQKIRIRIRNGRMVYYKQTSQHGLEVAIIYYDGALLNKISLKSIDDSKVNLKLSLWLNTTHATKI